MFINIIKFLILLYQIIKSRLKINFKKLLQKIENQLKIIYNLPFKNR